MHKSGSTIALNAGDYQAKIVTVGAGIASLTHRGRHMVIPHHPEEMPLAHLGKVLIPWPNRISGGTYHHDGKALQPAINDRTGNTAIHGLLAWVNWQIVEQSATSVTLAAFLPPSYGYPFMLSCEVTYQLNEETGLSARILTHNIGDVAAPYGAGVHPYLTCNLHSVDECELQLPTNEQFDVKTSTLTTIKALDFLTRRTIAATGIDHTFRVLKSTTPWQVTLAHPELTVWLRSTQPWLQIYSGEKLERKGLAVEPMSCPPDALNSGIDVVQLKPGEAHQLWFAIGGE